MKNYSELTTEEYQQCLEMIRSGDQYKDISNALQINRRVVSRIALENNIRKREYAPRNTYTRECNGYRKPNKAEVDVPTEIVVPGLEIMSWLKTSWKKLLNFLFGPKTKKVNSFRTKTNMEKTLTLDQIFLLVFGYMTKTSMKDLQKIAKLGRTDEQHAQQVRRLATYVLSLDKYAGIAKPSNWFYTKAMYHMGFENITELHSLTKNKFVTVGAAINWMFVNGYKSKEDFLTKNLF